MSNAAEERWWKAEKGDAHKVTHEYVRRVEAELGDVFQRLFLLECLYDPNNPEADPESNKLDKVTENAIASNVDTVSAIVATTDIRARFMTDGADWKQQRTARRLEWYAEDLQTRYDVLPKCRRAFKEAAKKGNGLVKVHNVLGAPRVEHVLVENIVVPPEETRDGRTPTQMHEWCYGDADELIARFPHAKDAIERARTSSGRRRIRFGSSASLLSNDVEYLESFRLPLGVKGEKGYIPGRHTITLDGEDLLDEKWEKDFFPYGMLVWSERVSSFYGISGAERIMGIQRALNRRNWQIERALDQAALPTTYVRPADANLAVKSNRVGAVAVIRGDYPHTPPVPVLNPETYRSRIDLRDAAQQEFGQTSMSVHGAKPSGLDSAVALREFKDQTTQRYGLQEKGFEQLVLDVIFIMIDCCKTLGAKAPKVVRRTRFGTRTLRWRDVDMGEVKVQMKAAANLNRTPAGRMQLVIEFAQAGIISTDQARRLLQHPDLEREMSLYTSSLDVVEFDLDEIADGNIVMPDPLISLSVAQWRAQREYAQWLQDGAPEEIMEALRQYIVQAIWMAKMSNQPIANTNAGPGAAAGDPMAAADPMAGGAVPPGAVPPMADPAAGAPTAAFADQAMQLRAG